MIGRLLAITGVLYAYMLEYRAELILWALSSSLPFILMGAWMQASTTHAMALTPDDFARYFLTVFVVRQLTVVWVIWELEVDVVKGRLSRALLAPMDPAVRYLLAHVAERGARLPFTFALIALFFLLYPSSFFVPSLERALLGVLAVVLAFVLRFLLQYTLGMLAFWTERASALETLFALVYMFCSGVIAPLTLFPTAIRDVLDVLPFSALIYFPAALILGWDVDVQQGFTVLLAWIVVFAVMNRVLWRAGLRRYTSMGA